MLTVYERGQCGECYGKHGESTQPREGGRFPENVTFQQSQAREEAGEGKDVPEQEFLVRGIVTVTHWAMASPSK